MLQPHSPCGHGKTRMDANARASYAAGAEACQAVQHAYKSECANRTSRGITQEWLILGVQSADGSSNR